MSETNIDQNEDERTGSENQEPNKPNPVEEQAKAMGWKPPEQWDGDNALTAQEFIDRNDRLKRRGDDILKAENAKLNRRLEEMQSTLDSLVTYTKKADSRARQRALEDIKREQRAAVEEGDTDRFDAAAAAMDELQKDVETETPPEKKPESAGESEAFKAWHKDNAWYGPGGDPSATLTANHAAEKLAGMGYTESELYEAVADIVKKEHPELFKPSENTNRKRPAAVEGAGNSGGSPTGGTMWSQVPKEDQAAFHKFVKEGLFKDTKEDREKFADDYLNG